MAAQLLYVKSATNLGANPGIKRIALNTDAGSFKGVGDDSLAVYPGRKTYSGVVTFESITAAMAVVGTKVAAPVFTVAKGGGTATITLTNAVFTEVAGRIDDGVGPQNVPEWAVRWRAKAVVIA